MKQLALDMNGRFCFISSAPENAGLKALMSNIANMTVAEVKIVSTIIVIRSTSFSASFQLIDGVSLTPGFICVIISYLLSERKEDGFTIPDIAFGYI